MVHITKSLIIRPNKTLSYDAKRVLLARNGLINNAIIHHILSC